MLEAILLPLQAKAPVTGKSDVYLTPLQLESRFGGQNYLDLVSGGVRGL